MFECGRNPGWHSWRTIGASQLQDTSQPVQSEAGLEASCTTAKNILEVVVNDRKQISETHVWLSLDV